MRGVAAAVVLMLTAPGAVLLATAPRAHAAESWVEVKAAGFTVVSDGSEKQARAVLGQFAQVRALMKSTWPWARLDPSRPVVVLAVRDEGGLRRLLPEFWERKNAAQPAGIFVSAPDRHWVALRMDVARSRPEDETWDNPYQLAFHEYVHLVLRLNFERLPAWLNEGLADFWGSTVIDGDRIHQGRYIGSHIRTLRNGTLLPIDRLLSAGHDQYSEANRATMLYAQSWALVHYLIHGSDERRGQLNRYAELRRAGKPDEEALKEAFGDIVVLERELASYVRRYVFRSLRYTAALDAATGPVTARALSPAESLGLRAGFYVATRRDAEAAALAAEALKAEPSAPAPHEALALAAFRGGRSDEALAELEKAVTSPEATDFAHYLHGRLLWSSAAGDSSLDRVEASLRRAVDLNPQFAEAHESLALVKAENGAPVDQTLPLAVRACVLEPTEIRYRITALRLGAHGGAVVEARAKARELLAWARGEERKQVEALLEELSDPRRLPPEAACAGGHAPSCHELGLRHRHGAGVPKDPVRAAAFFKKACEAGEPNACASLGWAYEEGSGVTRDLALAVPLYRKACDGGERWSCTRLANALSQGEGVARDPAAAAAVLQKSCDSDDPAACTMLGSMLRVGQGIPVDLARAESLLQRACDKGSGWGCGELGSLLLGRGTPETRRRAAALYEKGCGGDSPGSCAFLAQMLETGDGVRRDAARAKSLYRKACEGGYAPACPKAGPAP